jgi:hypothetical protein
MAVGTWVTGRDRIGLKDYQGEGGGGGRGFKYRTTGAGPPSADCYGTSATSYMHVGKTQ